MRLRIEVGLNQSRTWTTTTVSVHNHQYIKRKKVTSTLRQNWGPQPYTWPPPLRKVGVLWPPNPSGSPPLDMTVPAVAARAPAVINQQPVRTWHRQLSIDGTDRRKDQWVHTQLLSTISDRRTDRRTDGHPIDIQTLHRTLCGHGQRQ